jgi:hypothetical protein
VEWLMVEHLLSKCEALSLNPSTTKNTWVKTKMLMQHIKTYETQQNYAKGGIYSYKCLVENKRLNQSSFKIK